MPRFDPLFGLITFEKAAKFIAIFDVVLCCLFVLSHFVGGGCVYETQDETYEADLSKAQKIDDSVNVISLDMTTEGPNDSSSPLPKFKLSYDDYRKLIMEKLPSMDVMIVLGLFAMIFAIAHIFMEVWLCRLLLKAASHKDGSAIKIWFWCRLGMTIMFTLYSLAGIMSIKADFVDWICELVNIYRIYALYVVYDFKTQISACVNVVKPRHDYDV